MLASMNTILELRSYLDEAIKSHKCLKDNQAALASPTFSCRHAFPQTLEEPKSKKDIASLIFEKAKMDNDREIEQFFNRVEKLKTGIDSISVLQELGLRSGRSDTYLAPAISEMDLLLRETIRFKENLEQKVMFEDEAQRGLSDFFEMAELRLANASMGIERPDVTEHSHEELESILDNNRLVYGALCVENLVLSLGQVGTNHTICLQFERAVQKKILPDNDEIRSSLANYRVTSGHILAGVAKGLEDMERYIAGYGGAGMSIFPFKSAKLGFLKTQPSQSFTPQ